MIIDPSEETIDDRLGLFLPAPTLCQPCQSVVANGRLDLVQRGDRVEGLVGVRGFDISCIKDLAARVRPALGVRDARLLCILNVGAVAVTLQYRTVRPRQTQRMVDVLGRTARVIQEADFILFTHHRPEIGRLHLAGSGATGLDRRLIHRDDARASD